ncbi:uncharacterized protein LOC126108675 [Schistocerca cancellata]|uniref:uncharacterized protein LOC126108675 n=1 Tax=Schistocerca cancellata TaxID=274614 RepID=UPI0021195159|nr:uncharacterized protein LOC126108675 [Schistocerca cancellata]
MVVPSITSNQTVRTFHNCLESQQRVAGRYLGDRTVLRGLVAMKLEASPNDSPCFCSLPGVVLQAPLNACGALVFRQKQLHDNLKATPPNDSPCFCSLPGDVLQAPLNTCDALVFRRKQLHDNLKATYGAATYRKFIKLYGLTAPSGIFSAL